MVIQDDIKIISKETGGRVNENENLMAHVPEWFYIYSFDKSCKIWYSNDKNR